MLKPIFNAQNAECAVIEGEIFNAEDTGVKEEKKE
jgi:hypothetical protein